jgi:hypothetical protein
MYKNSSVTKFHGVLHRGWSCTMKCGWLRNSMIFIQIFLSNFQLLIPLFSNQIYSFVTMLIYRTYVKGLHKLWRKALHRKTIHKVHMNMGLQELPFWVTALKKTVKALSSLMPLQEVLQMFSMRFNTYLNTSHHWLSNTFRDARGVADSVTAIHRRWINKGF